MSILVVKEVEDKSDGMFAAEGVPVCGGNLESPVFDVANYIDEIHYRIGGRLYIENAD